jgi:hypothetical protein
VELSTRDWVVSKLKNHDEVSEIVVVGNQVIRVIRQQYYPFDSVLLDCETVEPDSFADLIDGSPRKEFVMSLRKHAVWTGAAIGAAGCRGVGWGGLGDLMSAINDEDIGRFQRREFVFVERGLRQHTKVAGWERINNRVYLVHRMELPSIRLVLINEYDLTTDVVRFYRDVYGEFDEVLSTNPNARMTTGAMEAAKHLKVVVFSWGKFMRRLHRR